MCRTKDSELDCQRIARTVKTACYTIGMGIAAGVLASMITSPAKRPEICFNCT